VSDAAPAPAPTPTLVRSTAGWEPSTFCDRERYRPGAPILATRGAAAEIPAALLPSLAPDARVFAGAPGAYFIFGGPAQPIRHWANGEMRAFDVPPVRYPYNHDFTDDGRRLFVACERHVVRVDLGTGAVDKLLDYPGVGASDGWGIAVAGKRVCVADGSKVHFFSTVGRLEPVVFPAEYTRFAAATADRRLVIVGGQRATRLFGVKNLEVAELAQFPGWWAYGFQEVDGQLRVSAYPRRDTDQLPKLVALELRDAPAAWTARFGG
jgi:hypothetical protein